MRNYNLLSKRDIRKLVFRYSTLLTFDEAYLLYQLAKECKGDIVEIGSYKGGSAVILAKALKEPYKVYAIEPHAKDLIKNIIKEKLENKIIPIEKTSEDAVKKWKKQIKLLWIDGNHDYEYVKKDFLFWEPYLVKDGIIVFHDSNYSNKIIPVLGFKHIKSKGPGKVVKEHLMNSDRFSEIKKVDTITYAKKNNKIKIMDLIKIKLGIDFKNIKEVIKKIFYKIDRQIGLFGKFLKKYFPRFYNLLKKKIDYIKTKLLIKNQ